MVQHLNAAAVESWRATKQIVDKSLHEVMTKSGVDARGALSILSSISQDANAGEYDDGGDSDMKRIRAVRFSLTV